MTTATLLPTLPLIDASATTAPRAEREPFTRGVAGVPRLLLRLEGAAIFLCALYGYAHLGGSWGWFAAMILVPDLSLLGYLVGPRIGAIAYNIGHSYLGPALLAAGSFALAAPSLLFAVAIWVAHIGFDRLTGYGLKYATAFADTHLGRVGRRA